MYAYKAAEANPHIESVLFSRQTDAAEEMEQGLDLGINYMDGSRKYVYNVYKYMDTEEQEKYTDFAKKIIGISDWKTVIKEIKEKVLLRGDGSNGKSILIMISGAGEGGQRGQAARTGGGGFRPELPIRFH